MWTASGHASEQELCNAVREQAKTAATVFVGANLVSASALGSVAVGTLSVNPAAEVATFAAGAAASGRIAAEVGESLGVSAAWTCFKLTVLSATAPDVPAEIAILPAGVDDIETNEPCPAGAIRFSGTVRNCDSSPAREETAWDPVAGELTVTLTCPVH